MTVLGNVCGCLIFKGVEEGTMSGKQMEVKAAPAGRLWITMPPEKDWIDRIRSVQGRKWHPDRIAVVRKKHM